jgi:hypothetical protein
MRKTDKRRGFPFQDPEAGEEPSSLPKRKKRIPRKSPKNFCSGFFPT